MTSVFFVLPGLFYVFDGVINHTTIGLNFYNTQKEAKAFRTVLV